jgi:hypothetical protein
MKCEEEHVDHFLNSDRAVNLFPQAKLVISRITGCATGKHPEKRENTPLISHSVQTAIAKKPPSLLRICSL